VRSFRQAFYRRDTSVNAVMIEVNRALCMDEETGAESNRFDKTRAAVAQVLAAFLAAFLPDILFLVPLPQFQPMPVGHIRDPFSGPNWLFEIKWDGFRALVYSDKDGVRLVSRNGNVFRSFSGLCDGLARDLRGRRCVLDGEIVCLDTEGRTNFRNLLFRRAEPFFYAFDILWDAHPWSDDEHERRRFRNGEDVRYLPLSDRKLRLRAAVPKRSERLLYCDHIEDRGEELFRLACEHDLEGLVAKHRNAPYLPDQATWLKIRNHSYSQWVGRAELFERERGTNPDFCGWNSCVAACAGAL
jgi:ATP-dependent DNA ligase